MGDAAFRVGCRGVASGTLEMPVGAGPNGLRNWRGAVESGEVWEGGVGVFGGVRWGSVADGVDSIICARSGRGFVLLDRVFVPVSIPCCKAQTAGRTVVDCVFTVDESERGSEKTQVG